MMMMSCNLHVANFATSTTCGMVDVLTVMPCLLNDGLHHRIRISQPAVNFQTSGQLPRHCDIRDVHTSACAADLQGRLHGEACFTLSHALEVGASFLRRDFTE